MSVSNGQAANAATFNGAFVSKTANSTVSGTITQDKESVLKEIATPATPSSGYGKIYFKSDGKLYQLNDAGTETVVGAGAGGGGGLNYIANGSAEDNNTTGWATYANAAGASPVTGTGGTANVTISATATTPLIGTYSFLMAKDAANRQGQGWSYDFSIDLAYRAKVLQISFDYLVNFGTFVAGATGSNSDVTVWIYDVTNAVLIQPSNIKLFSNNASITDKFQASFQTASNSSSYRLIFHVASTSASAYTLEVDNVSVSPSDYVFGTPVTDWQSYTPTISAGFGTTSGVSFKWRRVGDSAQVIGTFTAGTVAASLGSFTLPPGLALDSSKLGVTSNTISAAGQKIGLIVVQQSGSGNTWPIVTCPGTSSSLVYVGSRVGTTTALTPENVSLGFNTGAVVAVEFTAPIMGLSSSVQTSDSADTRVVDFVGFKNATQAVTAGATDITFTSQKDSHGAWNGSQFIVPVSGDYLLALTIKDNAGTQQASVYVDGSAYRATFITSVSGFPQSGAILVHSLRSGQALSVRSSTGGTVGTDGVLSISRISGPSAIAASETVAMAYSLSANQSASTTVSIKYDVREFDTHNAYSSATGQFTAPISGTYSISALGAALGATWGGQIHKNGSATAYKTILQGVVASGLGSGTTLIKLNAGETVEIRPSTSVTIYGGPLNSSSGAACTIAITKVGN